jgi:DNA-binding MarR family transcriptional regulator
MHSVEDYQNLAMFRYHIRRFLRFSEDIAKGAGIEPQQHQLMMAVKGAPADEQPTIRFIAERLQIRHNSAVELVDRSERRGLVRRQSDAKDLRRVIVQLTAAGERLLRGLADAHFTEMQQQGPQLAQLLRVLVHEQNRLERKRHGGEGIVRAHSNGKRRTPRQLNV